MSSSDPNRPKSVGSSHGGYPAVGATSAGIGVVSNGNVAAATHRGVSTGDVKASSLTFTLAPQHAIMQWGSMADGNMDVTFTEEENGTWVKATLATSYDLTPKEGLAINLLITGISILSDGGSGARATIRPISFIRTRNLERHFNISLV